MATLREVPAAALKLLRGQPRCRACWRRLLLLRGAACWGAAVAQRAARRLAGAGRGRGAGGLGRRASLLQPSCHRWLRRPRPALQARGGGDMPRGTAARFRYGLPALTLPPNPWPQVLGADGMLYQTPEDLLSVGHELNPALQQFEASCFNGAPGARPGTRPRAAEQARWREARVSLGGAAAGQGVLLSESPGQRRLCLICCGACVRLRAGRRLLAPCRIAWGARMGMGLGLGYPRRADARRGARRRLRHQ